MVGISFFGNTKSTPAAAEKKSDSKPQSSTEPTTSAVSTPAKTEQEPQPVTSKPEEKPSQEDTTNVTNAASHETKKADNNGLSTETVTTPAATDAEPATTSDSKPDTVQSEPEASKEKPEASKSETMGASTTGEEIVQTAASDASASAKVDERPERPKPTTRDSMGDKFRQAIHWDHKERHFPSMHHRKRPE